MPNVKPRLLDLVLLASLVVVSGAIVWTLFSLGRSSDEAATGGSGGDTPAVVLPDDAEGDAAEGERVVPIAPGAEAQATVAQEASDAAEDAAEDENDDGDGSEVVAQPDATPDEAADDADEEDDGATEEIAGADAGGIPSGDRLPSASEAGPPPEGEVALERIGFSFVTGGAGACGVTLEPWEHVAVSRELLEAYGCGAEVTVALSEEIDGRNTFEAVVADTMNETFSRTVNVYVGQDEPAMAYGLIRGRLTPEE